MNSKTLNSLVGEHMGKTTTKYHTLRRVKRLGGGLINTTYQTIQLLNLHQKPQADCYSVLYTRGLVSDLTKQVSHPQ